MPFISNAASLSRKTAGFNEPDIASYSVDRHPVRPILSRTRRYETDVQTTGKRYPLFLMALAILTAAIAPVTAGILWVNVIVGADSTNLLNHLVTHAGFEHAEKSEIELINADGPMPEMSRQSIPVAENAEDPIPALKKICADIGLEQPRADRIAVEPDTICTGLWNGGRMQVNAALQCKPGPCLLYIETSAFGF